MPEAKFENMERGGSMRVSEENIRLIKSRIEKYYQNCKNIEWQTEHLNRLSIRLEKIQNDINSPQFNFCLNIDIKAVSYDGIAIQGSSLISSGVERELEQIYLRLEKEKAETELEILETNMLIRRLENDNYEIERCIRLLGIEYRNILESKFKRHKSLTQISFEANMSKSNVARALYDIYADFYKLLYMKL